MAKNTHTKLLPQLLPGATQAANAANAARAANMALSAGRGGNQGGLFGGMGMLPLMMGGMQGNDMMSNYLMFRMLSGGMGGQNQQRGGMFGGLSPLIMGNMLGMDIL